MPEKDSTGADLKVERLVRMRAEMYTLWCQGWTQEKIGERYSMPRSTVADHLRTYRKTIPPADREATRQDHARLLQVLKESMADLVKKDGTPVTAGKDGRVVTDPISGAVVRDYSLRIAAGRELRALIEREAKALGTDAAAKVEHSGTIAVEGTVEAEIARLSAELGLAADSQVAIPAASSSADSL